MSKEPRDLTTPMEILEAALQKEKSAYQFYDNLMNNTNIELLQEIIEQLRDEEYKHILIIEKKMAQLRSS